MPRRVLVALAAVGALAAPTLATAAAPSLVKLLAAPIASAKRHGLKVLVPSTIAAHAPHLYGSGGASAKGYDLRLASAPGCDDANACYVAEFTAGPGKAMRGDAVALAGGRRGRFVASRCGASCNPATIAWREYGLDYSIAYIGSRRALVALADAAIAAGPR